MSSDFITRADIIYLSNFTAAIKRHFSALTQPTAPINKRFLKATSYAHAGIFAYDYYKSIDGKILLNIKKSICCGEIL